MLRFHKAVGVGVMKQVLVRVCAAWSLSWGHECCCNCLTSCTGSLCQCCKSYEDLRPHIQSISNCRRSFKVLNILDQRFLGKNPLLWMKFWRQFSSSVFFLNPKIFLRIRSIFNLRCNTDCSVSISHCSVRWRWQKYFIIASIMHQQFSR